MRTDEQFVDSALNWSRQLGAGELASIAKRMCGEGGVPVADRRYRLTVYPACFRGDEAVDWLMTELVLSRPQAVRMGQRLHAHRLIRHVLDEHDFADAELFYRFAQVQPAPLPGDAEAGEISLNELREWVQAMRSADGPRLGTQYHRLIRYPNCFDGRDAVTWLAERMKVSRTHATAIGRRMLRRDLIRHVFDEHDFEDRRLFYRFL